MADGLELRVLGPLELIRKGDAVSLGGIKPRLLLGTLALHHGRVVSTGQLADILWPKGQPRSAVANVQTYVSGLRSLFGSQRLHTSSGGYRLVLGDDELDLRRFEKLCASDALSDLEEAVALWRGDPLEDLPVAGVWSTHITGLKEKWRAARQARARQLIDTDRARLVLSDLRDLVADDPLREEGWLLLVRALAAAGQRAEALAAYADARRTLAAELGIEPGEPLRRLHRELLVEQPIDAAPLDGAAGVVLRGLARLALGTAPAWTAAALADCRDPAPVLRSLVTARLLREAENDRFAVPALVNLLAPDLPGDSGDAPLLRVLGGYLHLADQAVKALPVQVFGPGVKVAPRWPTPESVPDATAWFTEEQPSIERAVEAAAELRRADFAWELAHALVPWCDLGGHTSGWERTHNTALEACRQAGDQLGEAVTLRGLGQLHVYRDNYEAAAEAFGRSRLLFARLGNDCGEAGALAGLGTVLRIRGEIDQAYGCFRQVLASYVQAGDLHGQAFAQGSLGQSLLARGDLPEAAQALRQGMAIATEIGDEHRLAHLTQILGVVFLRQGETEAAHGKLTEAMKQFEAIGDAHGEAYCLTHLSDLEPVESAIVRLTQALDIFERIGDRQAQAKCARRLGELHRDAGRGNLGGAFLDEAARLQAAVTPW
ncbi:BTAD domain-containing putative transcriptional regulator [Catelliglobosispora koreensis]|uniref:BTAD domain-containing putative transcriptional regulator n=1 Tax=Catelliglobosispora koreensis TaxID=129052 RepID=UPI00036FDC3E|nr:BTAD domain-containing putative transcriptional regulator [Catelliglobosispora koreensis]